MEYDTTLLGGACIPVKDWLCVISMPILNIHVERVIPIVILHALHSYTNVLLNRFIA